MRYVAWKLCSPLNSSPEYTYPCSQIVLWSCITTTRLVFLVLRYHAQQTVDLLNKFRSLAMRTSSSVSVERLMIIVANNKVIMTNEFTCAGNSIWHVFIVNSYARTACTTIFNYHRLRAMEKENRKLDILEQHMPQRSALAFVQQQQQQQKM